MHLGDGMGETNVLAATLDFLNFMVGTGLLCISGTEWVRQMYLLPH